MDRISLAFEIESLASLERAQTSLNMIDAYLAILPEAQNDYLTLLEPILAMPRMSTFANGAIIARSVREMALDTAYVNVGVWHGYSLLAGMLAGREQKVVGIDNFSQFGGPRDSAMGRFDQIKSDAHSLHEMDYRDYFSNLHEGEIGFYFYDGEHSYENQLKGLQVAEPFFARDCIVLVDDTNWDDPRRATLDFMAESQNEYEVLLDRRTAWNGHPTFWNGIMVLRRVT
ncbi:MAG: class I SAM-dependent methyltransferase [Pseudomonadota bacterium]